MNSCFRGAALLLIIGFSCQLAYAQDPAPSVQEIPNLVIADATSEGPQSLENSEKVHDQQEPNGSAVPQPATPEGGRDVLQAENRHMKVPGFALTLAGGGGPCAAHIGVLKALEANGLRPDFIAGSSLGALIGALYAGGVPVQQLEQMAINGEIEKAFFPISPHKKAIVWVPLYGLKRLIGLKPPIGLFNGKRIAKFVNAKIPLHSKRIEDLPTKFAAVAVNLEDTKAFWITKGDVGQAVRASATLPFMYQPVETAERTLVDGGMRAVLPTEVAQAAGAPVIVASRLHSHLQTEPSKTFRNLGKYAERIGHIFLTEIEAKALSGADVLIEPDLSDIRTKKLDRTRMAKAIKAGEQATLRIIPQLREKLQAATGTATRTAPGAGVL